MSTHNLLCFEQKYEKNQNILSENVLILVVKYSVHLNRRVFVMLQEYGAFNRWLKLNCAGRLKYFMYTCISHENNKV